MRFYTEVSIELGELAACVYTAIENQLRQGGLGTIRECDGCRWIQKGIDQIQQEFLEITPTRLQTALRKLSRSDWLESGIPNREFGARRLWYTMGKKRLTDPRMDESSIVHTDPVGDLALEPRGKAKPTYLERWLARKPPESLIERDRKSRKEGMLGSYKNRF